MLGPIDLSDPVAKHPLNEGLVGWWLPLENNWGGSTLRDIAGHNHGTLTNGPTWTTPDQGHAGVALDGTDDFVRVPHSPDVDITGPFSICLTVMALTNAVFYQPAFSKEDWPSAVGYYLGLNPNVTGNGVYFGINRGANEVTATTAAPVNVVSRLVGIYSGSGLVLYSGGAQVASGGNSTAPTSHTNPLDMGHIYTTADNYATCRIYEARLYARALTASEAAEWTAQSRLGHPDTLNRRKVWGKRAAPAGFDPAAGFPWMLQSRPVPSRVEVVPY